VHDVETKVYSNFKYLVWLVVKSAPIGAIEPALPPRPNLGRTNPTNAQFLLKKYGGRAEQQYEAPWLRQMPKKMHGAGFLFTRQFRFAERIAGSNSWPGFVAVYRSKK
jgi:hypothetical protein